MFIAIFVLYKGFFDGYIWLWQELEIGANCVQSEETNHLSKEHIQNWAAILLSALHNLLQCNIYNNKFFSATYFVKHIICVQIMYHLPIRCMFPCLFKLLNMPQVETISDDRNSNGLYKWTWKRGNLNLGDSRKTALYPALKQA